MTKMQRLVIRADASPTIGSGHVMRTLALAQAWRDAGGEVAYQSDALTERLAALLSEESIARTDTADDADWVVIDGYQFNAADQRRHLEQGQRVLWVDDHGHADAYSADLVLNINPGARVAMYANRDVRSELLLGLRYALLRREFTDRQVSSASDEVRAVLVTLGGGGGHEARLSRIVSAVDSLGQPFEVRVIGGNIEAIEPAAHCKVTYYTTSGEMPGMMAWADVAIAATGGTAWELAYMGVPQVAFVVAGNQMPNARALRAAGLIDAPLTTNSSAEEIAAALRVLVDDRAIRQRRSEIGRQLLDGGGAERVVRAMMTEPLQMRDATEADSRWLWELANDEAVRAASFGREPIAWEDHTAWYAARLADRDALIYIALLTDDTPVGYARFAMNDSTHTATISIALTPAARGKGLAGRLIRRGVQRLALARGVKTIEAIVHPGNAASVAAFMAEGFAAAGTVEHAGQPGRRFVYDVGVTP